MALTDSATSGNRYDQSLSAPPVRHSSSISEWTSAYSGSFVDSEHPVEVLRQLPNQPALSIGDNFCRSSVDADVVLEELGHDVRGFVVPDREQHQMLAESFDYRHKADLPF